MAFDLALSDTNDLIFGPTRDLLGVTGVELDKQRIQVRCKIPRGSFIYDDDGQLGSNLILVPRNPGTMQLRVAESYVHEALDDMEGISVQSVDASVSEDGINVDVKFTQSGQLDADARIEDTTDEDDVVEFDTRILFSERE